MAATDTTFFDVLQSIYDSLVTADDTVDLGKLLENVIEISRSAQGGAPNLVSNHYDMTMPDVKKVRPDRTVKSLAGPCLDWIIRVAAEEFVKNIAFTWNQLEEANPSDFYTLTEFLNKLLDCVSNTHSMWVASAVDVAYKRFPGKFKDFGCPAYVIPSFVDVIEKLPLGTVEDFCAAFPDHMQESLTNFRI